MKQFSSIHYIVFLLIATSIIMNFAYYMHTRNFNSPIIDYEFVKNKTDVEKILMSEGEFKKDIIRGLRDQNIVDYVYMITYSALLYFVFIKISKFKKSRFLIIGAIFAILALFADIVENIQLFNISESLISRINFSQSIKVLTMATNIKWFSIAIALFIISFHYYKNKITGKIFAFFSSLPLILGIAYFALNSTELRDCFTLSITIGFVFLMVWMFISKYINKDISFYKETQD